jgi:signal transduction histidine kinase
MAVTDIAALREGWRPRPDDGARAGNDTEYAGRVAFFRLIDANLGEVVRSKLGGQIARAAATARVLVDQGNEAHMPAGREVVEAMGLAEGMLNDVLEFWQWGFGGGARMSRRRIDLRSVCERVVDVVQLRYPTHGLGLECPKRVEGHWDPDAIAALVMRLVLNAVHHGPADGAVRVRLAGAADAASFEVHSALPIAADLPVHRLFEPFVCARPRRLDGESGLGLGLYLANQVARAHQGRIEVESDQRAGTIFRAVLPFA